MIILPKEQQEEDGTFCWLGKSDVKEELDVEVNVGQWNQEGRKVMRMDHGGEK